MLLYGKTKYFEWKEQRQVKKRFYSNQRFKQLDHILLRSYRGLNPYRICKKSLQKQNAQNIYTYGETPLTTLEKLVREFGIKPGQKIIEMGAGRGRASLFLAEYIGCKVVSFEEIPEFVNRMVPSPHIHMHTANMFEVDLPDADFVYLYGTMLSDAEIHTLIKKFPKKAKIITVSYPLNEYSDEYKLVHQCTGTFPWGKTEIYLNNFSPHGL